MRRVLCLDLRSAMFGYVVFEGPRTLLDWGTRRYVRGEQSSLDARVSYLRSMFAPSVILVREPAQQCRTRRPLSTPAIHALTVFAKRAHIPMRLIGDSALRSHFSKGLEINKHDIARMVARRFPELSWRLPSKRKAWQSEPPRQLIFDAASLGVVFFAQEIGEQPNARQDSG